MTETTTPRTHSKGLIAGASLAGVAIIAGAVTAIMLAFSSPASAHHAITPPPAPAPAHHTISPAVPAHPTNPNPPANNNNVTPPPALPAAQVDTIQRELAQLNYYEGPINGVMTPQTIQAITYLQRDAQLPQNGDYNQITYLALQQMLAHGNNQMGGNN